MHNAADFWHGKRPTTEATNLEQVSFDAYADARFPDFETTPWIVQQMEKSYHVPLSYPIVIV